MSETDTELWGRIDSLADEVGRQAEVVRDLQRENAKLTGQLRAALAELAKKPVVHQPAALHDLKQRALESEYRLALQVVKHCFLFQGREHCGFELMTDEEKDLFRSVTGYGKEVAK